VKLRALDLFCGAGGASWGLHLAGFNVTGVDIVHSENYPLGFTRADALTFPLDGYDLIWTSPPCQGFTAYKRRKDHVKPCENLIPAIRERLIASGVPYIIENVPGAPLINPTLLCGSMFGLDVRRHRLFETSFPVTQLSCAQKQTGSFPQATNRTNRRKTVEVGVYRIPLDVQRKAMGIHWMNLQELSQAIPPAYAEYLGLSFRMAAYSERKRA
jgi:DNA (cytosine-5)-methyltransferase 1